MPLTTISSSLGVDGYGVAELVAQKLGVELIDDSNLHKVVRNSGLTDLSRYHFDQHAPGFWDRLLSRDPQIYLDTIEAAVYEIARTGEGVIIGHGSQMLLRDYECAFHVRLLSDFESRVDDLVASQKIDRENATNLLKQSDRDQKGFFRYAFQIDLETPSLYDLIIQMGKMKNETVARVITEAVRSEDIQSCNIDALTSMKKMSQERKIHAKLLERNIDVSTLNVSVFEIGKAKITGVAASQEEKVRIPDIVHEVDEISSVETDVSVWIYSL